VRERAVSGVGWGPPYEYLYRTGRTPWDTGITPPEVVDLIEGPSPLPPGRALDLGCGTGTNVAYLAQHGWRAVGVDLSEIAVGRAGDRIEGVVGASVVRGDVTRLHDLGLEGPFDLVLDIGCFHTLPRGRRDAYARGVGEFTTSDAVLFLFAFPARVPWILLGGGVSAREMRDRFAPWFEPVGRISGERPPGAAWYRLRRV
jgi:SAM-dependent methyltransferase